MVCVLAVMFCCFLLFMSLLGYVFVIVALPGYRCFLGRLFTISRAIEYKRQNFLKVVVHVVIIDQCNQTARLTRSR